MFMRLVQVKAKPDKLPALRRYYDESVIPALQKTPGCLNACLMQSSQHPDEVISMTMWETQSHAESYERSGLYRKLLDEARPMFADSSEWRVELSKDLKLEHVPTPVEPTVKSFPVAVMSRELNTDPERPKDMYLRIVSVTLKREKEDEFRELYLHEIIPTLQTTKGCRHAYLLMPGGGKGEAMSVTIWDSKAAAEEYETGNTFSDLLDKVKHTFTDLFQWKMKLDPSQRQTATSNDISVERYFLVGGRSFKGP